MQAVPQLDTAASLIENAMRLPDGSELSYGTQKFDTLDAATQKCVRVMAQAENLTALCGFSIKLHRKNFPPDLVRLTEEAPDGPAFDVEFFRNLIAVPHWRNFARYKDDPRYRAYVERIKKACDLSEKENISFVLKTGMVKSPCGKRLVAVATEDKEDRRWVYIFMESPENGFAGAMESFGEFVKVYGIYASTALLAVNGDGNPVPIPEEVTAGIGRVLAPENQDRA